MMTRPRASIPFLLLLSILFLSATLSLSSTEQEDPELKQCKQQCRQQPYYDPRMRQQCERRCEEQHQKKEDPEQRLQECKRECRERREGEQQRQQCERRCEEQHQKKEDPEQQMQECKRECRERREGEQQQQQCERRCEEQHQKNEDPEQQMQECKRECRESREGKQQRQQCERRCEQRYQKKEDPEQRLQECKRECRKRRGGEQERHQCERRCEERYQKERREGEEECRRECQEKEEGRRQQRECEQRCEEEYREHRGGNLEEEEREEGKEEKRREGDPYFFDEESFMHRVRTEHGHIRVLRNFLERSKLLLGVANYRVAVIEANPNTFVLPRHMDAEALLFVARGNGMMTLTCQDNKETHELRRGDITRVRAGAIVSFMNKDRNEKLVIVCLLQPVAIPGVFEAFVGAGGQNPESFYRSFSKPVLRAAFNTQEDKLETLFGKQQKGDIIQASQKQIREMSRQISEGRSRPFGESRRPFNILDKRPSHSNRHGELREADRTDYPELRDLDIQVSLTNINRGSMMAPNFNTEATTIAFVVGGKGDVQIVCPHLSGQQEEGRGPEEEEKRRGQHYRRVQSEVSRDTVFIVPAGHPSVAVSSRDENLEVLCFKINARDNQRTWLAGSNNVLKQMDKVTKELSFDQPARDVDEVLNASREEVFMEGPKEREQERGLEFATF